MYQLKDLQSENSTLCLFTDFDSQVDVLQNKESAVFVSNKTVLDMKAMDSKSNGAIAWSNEKSFNCNEAFKVNVSSSSFGEWGPERSPCFKRAWLKSMISKSCFGSSHPHHWSAKSTSCFIKEWCILS